MTRAPAWITLRRAVAPVFAIALLALAVGVHLGLGRLRVDEDV